jgi:hypothetical protein
VRDATSAEITAVTFLETTLRRYCKLIAGVHLELDQQLMLYFDSRHAMYYAHPERIDGLSDIGSILASDRPKSLRWPPVDSAHVVSHTLSNGMIVASLEMN